MIEYIEMSTLFVFFDSFEGRRMNEYRGLITLLWIENKKASTK